MPNHKVRQGECIESIAKNYGLFWQSIWNDPKNMNLKTKRSDPDVLMPGDTVYIRDKTLKWFDGATENKHRFKRKGIPSKLKIRLMDGDEPRARTKCILIIDGSMVERETDSDGWLIVSIPPGAKQGDLIVGDGEEEHHLQLGWMDPPDEISGIQARLNNLGFFCGDAEGVLGPGTVAALRIFQRKHDLPVTGKPDKATVNKLVSEHGC